MSESESDALPLGDTPIFSLYTSVRYIDVVTRFTRTTSKANLSLYLLGKISSHTDTVMFVPHKQSQQLGDTPITKPVKALLVTGLVGNN